MSKTRRATYCRAALSLALIFTTAPIGAVDVYTPASGDEVIAELPRHLPSAVLKRAAISDPVKAAGAAAEYLDLGRYSGDPRYYGYAEARLQPWWNESAAPLPVRKQRARILQHRHDYVTALEDLDAFLSASPRDMQARLTRAYIHLVQGRPVIAQRDCAELFGVSVDIAALCLADVRGRSGHLEAAQTAVARIAKRMQVANASKPIWHWIETIQAEMAVRAGALPEAEQHFRAALALFPDDPATLAGMADVLLDQRRNGEVVKLLARDQQAEMLLLRLAIAQKRLSSPLLVQTISLLDIWLESETGENELGHGREQARYFLDVVNKPNKALSAAVSNWTLQREPEDLLLLLRAARTANQPAAASDALTFIRETSLQDVRLAELTQQIEQGADQ